MSDTPIWDQVTGATPTTSNRTPKEPHPMSSNDIRISAEQEAELMAAFHAWYETWSAAGQAFGAERVRLDGLAASIFRTQLANPDPAYRAGWLMIQNTLSNWWELPEQMRDWLRAAPLQGGFQGRANRAIAALDTDDEEPEQ